MKGKLIAMNQVSEPRVERLQQHLLSAAPRYYPELASAVLQIELAGAAPHHSSTIYHFRLQANGCQRGVLVKTPPLTVHHPPSAQLTAPEIKFRSEYEALTDIHAHFNRLGDARFAAVRPLDFVAEVLGIVMEEVNYPTLRSKFSKTSRLQAWERNKEFFIPFRHAGSWLRAFHALDRGEHATPREVDRDAFLTVLSRLAEMLSSAIGNQSFFQKLTARLHQEALQILPAQMPLGLTHGDYALRNLLVAPGNRVLALDTQARWLMPVYEDVAYFLTGLITTWPQVLSQGLVFEAGHLERCEQEFLQGYFEHEAVPWEIIRLFRLKLMLQKWSAKTLSVQRQPGSRYASTVRQRLLHRFFYKTVTAMLEGRLSPTSFSRGQTRRTPQPMSVASAGRPQRSDELLQLSRRLDWRFLLPEPRLQQVAYFGPAESTLVTALKTFSESLTMFPAVPAATRAATPTRFAVVVAVAPSPAALAGISEVVQPGGFLYAELGSFFAGRKRGAGQSWRQAFAGPQEYVAALQRLGFERVVAYWHRPSFEAAAHIIPLGDPLALQFVLDRHSHDWKNRLIAALERAALHSGALARWLECISLVARKQSFA